MKNDLADIVHIVHLFKYLEKKYFIDTDTDVTDEGNYWETLDKAVLHERFDVYNGLMDAVGEALESAEWQPTHDPHQIALQLEELLKNRFLPPVD